MTDTNPGMRSGALRQEVFTTLDALAISNPVIERAGPEFLAEYLWLLVINDDSMIYGLEPPELLPYTQAWCDGRERMRRVWNERAWTLGPHNWETGN